MIVYKAINNVNGKLYIGYTTKSLEERANIHFYKSKSTKGKHYNYVFSSAIRKYGFENFSWEILQTCKNIEECLKTEINLIAKYNTLSPNGYNISKGGNGGALTGDSLNRMISSLKNHYKIKDWKEVLTKEQRSNNAKKANVTKKNNGYKWPTFKQSEKSKMLMSKTKNMKNRLNWVNSKTKEFVYLSLTEMSKYTGLSIGTFSHIKQGRYVVTKCGWHLGIF